MDKLRMFKERFIALDYENSSEKALEELNNVCFTENIVCELEHCSLLNYIEGCRNTVWKCIVVDDGRWNAYKGQTAQRYIDQGKHLTAEEILGTSIKVEDNDIEEIFA